MGLNNGHFKSFMTYPIFVCIIYTKNIASKSNVKHFILVNSLKTALLLALASVKRVGDLQVLSVSASCPEFGPNDYKVVLKPRLGYVPKVLSTPFRAQVILLSALLNSVDEQDLHILCPVKCICRALCPFHSGVSIGNICAVAGWSSPSTFARFYSLGIPALQTQILSD